MKFLGCAWIAALALAGCTTEDSSDDTGVTSVATNASNTQGMTGDPATSAPGSSDGADDAPLTDGGSLPGTDGSTSATPGTTSGPSDSSGGDGTGAGTTGAVGSPCDPDPAGSACDECTKMKCCPQLETCFDDPICVCMTECVMGPLDIDPCAQSCGQTANFMPVTDCAANMCLFECIG